jgi:hypothetical protein
MTPRLRRLLLAAPLAIGALLPLSGGAHAAGSIPAAVEAAHLQPVNGKVAALLIGKSFLPRERVHVTYRVTIGTAHRTAQFDARSDGWGAFKRTIRFTLPNRGAGYTLRVTATGAQGDRATLNTWASGH